MRSIGTTLRIALLLIIATAIGYSVFHFGLLSAGGAVVVTAALILAGMLWLRIFELSRQISVMQVQSRGMAEFEQDLNRRLDSVANKVSGLEANANTQSDAQMNALSKQVSAFSERLESVEKNTGLAFDRIRADEAAKAKLEKEERSSSGVVAQPRALAKIDLKEALKGGALSMHLQPVVDLPARTPQQYEAFMRLQLKNGEFLDAKQFIKVAEQGGLMPMIDKKVIFSAIRMVRKLKEMKKESGIFCNISPDTLEDARKFRDVLSMLEANSSLKSSLVIEISQRRLRHLGKAAQKRLMKVVDLGFSLSLDQVQDLAVDWAELRKQGFRYMKVPAGILLHSNLEKAGSGTAQELAAKLADEGIVLIGTETERESEVMGLIDYGVTAAQGLAFAPPRPIKEELLAGPVSGKPTSSAA